MTRTKGLSRARESKKEDRNVMSKTGRSTDSVKRPSQVENFGARSEVVRDRSQIWVVGGSDASSLPDEEDKAGKSGL